MLTNDQAAFLVRMGHNDPEGFKAAWNTAKRMTTVSARLSLDDDINRWELEKAVAAVCNPEKEGIPRTLEQVTTQALQRIGKSYPPDEYANVYKSAKDAVCKILTTSWGWREIAGGVSCNPPDSWGIRHLDQERRERAVNALTFKRPGQEPYREGKIHLESSPRKAKERFPHAETSWGQFSVEDAESVPAEAVHFTGPIEAKIVSIIEPYLAKNADASDDKIVRHVFERLPYLEVESRLSQVECRLSILSLLVRRFGRKWDPTKTWTTIAATYPENWQRPANLPRSVPKPSESLREKAGELLESKGASAFSVDDRPALSSAEKAKLIDRMVSRAH
jgi:hypothetical protein